MPAALNVYFGTVTLYAVDSTGMREHAHSRVSQWYRVERRCTCCYNMHHSTHPIHPISPINRLPLSALSTVQQSISYPPARTEAPATPCC